MNAEIEIFLVGVTKGNIYTYLRKSGNEDRENTLELSVDN